MVVKTELFVCSLTKEQTELRAVGSLAFVPCYEEIYSRVSITGAKSSTKVKVIASSSIRPRTSNWVYSNLGVIACKGLNEWRT